MDEKRVAILIDADNTSYKYFETVINEAAKEGVITYKRIYGDWSNSQLASYRESLHSYSIKPVQSMSNIKGKNSTDISMVIEAMDILYSGNVEVFCIVSSDSDFTALATRLKESGKRVVGMGKKKQTPESFVKACSQFISIDKISEDKEEAEVTEEGATIEAATGIEESAAGEAATDTEESATGEAVTDTEENGEVKKVRLAIEKMLQEEESGDGWILLTTVTQRLREIFPEFDPRNYGFRKMQPFVVDMGFSTKSVRAGGKTSGPAAVYIHMK